MLLVSVAPATLFRFIVGFDTFLCEQKDNEVEDSSSTAVHKTKQRDNGVEVHKAEQRDNGVEDSSSTAVHKSELIKGTHNQRIRAHEDEVLK
ncbi:hypothetical protein V6N13_106709 [Hibiscus sabdariffa]|uniref:Uncharacterized protein n=1 Tax=Hibiscus sabdariffa TaxID=183260 RepID=A0ABR2F1J5_9ROSI